MEIPQNAALTKIRNSDQEEKLRNLAQAAMDGKAKPPGSLGTLEDIAIKLAVLQDTLVPSIEEVTLIIFAADHGFTASTPGVSAYPREVSTSVYRSIANGDAASAVLSKANKCKLKLIDVGLDADIKYDKIYLSDKNSHIIISEDHVKVRYGSRDFLQGPAMTNDEFTEAYDLGEMAVKSLLVIGDGMFHRYGSMVAIGELGIGNTTAAAAVVCALTGNSPELVCGRGTGVDDVGLELKISTVKAALEKNKDLVSTGDPSKIVQAVGGLEIAAMMGAYSMASHYDTPAIVDGFISGAAALAACSMDPNIERCLFWSHKSAEQGATLLMEAVREVVKNYAFFGVKDNSSRVKGVIPILDLGLKLGEGTGAVLAVPILRSAAAIMSNMAALKDIL